MAAGKENNTHIYESEDKVKDYITRMLYLLEKRETQITIQYDRNVDNGRELKFTNRYTIADLFPDDNPENAVRRELKKLRPENYIETVIDKNFSKRAPFRVFGMVYPKGDVYIKIKIELLTTKEFGAGRPVYVMSFHYSTIAFRDEIFPYKK